MAWKTIWSPITKVKWVLFYLCVCINFPVRFPCTGFSWNNIYKWLERKVSDTHYVTCRPTHWLFLGSCISNNYFTQSKFSYVSHPRDVLTQMFSVLWLTQHTNHSQILLESQLSLSDNDPKLYRSHKNVSWIHRWHFYYTLSNFTIAIFKHPHTWSPEASVPAPHSYHKDPKRKQHESKENIFTPEFCVAATSVRCY